MRQRASQGINEILVGFKRSRFESHIQGRVARSKNSVDATTRRRRCEFTRIDGQDVGIVTIAELPGRRHRLMVFRQLFGSLPHALREDLEVPERAAPGFHRVCRDPSVPVQFVDREVAMLDGGQDPCEPNILHMSVGPKL